MTLSAGGRGWNKNLWSFWRSSWQQSSFGCSQERGANDCWGKWRASSRRRGKKEKGDMCIIKATAM